ncbi:MAG: hypothetical protein ACR2JW_18595 [Thermomicrobiales bacterium]
MDKTTRNEELPGTKERDPAEGKRADAPQGGAPTGIPERPGTKTAPPAEGGDDTSGARETGSSGR